MPIIQIEGAKAFSFGDRTDARIVQLTVADAITLFSKYSVKRPSLRENLFEIWSFHNIGRNLKAKFMHLSGPRHILSKRKNGCQWNPKGKVQSNLDEFSTGAVEYNGEQCPDGLYDSCMERIFGVGNGVEDFLSSPEAESVLKELMDKIYTALHNSVYDLLTWANHPLITQSDANQWWTQKTDSKTWADFKDQQLHDEIGGHMTTLDSLATVDGLDHLNVPLQSGWVEGKKFIGDIDALFQSLVEAAPADFETMIDTEREKMPPVIMVTRGLFNAYSQLVNNKFTQIPQGYYLYTQGDDKEGINRPIRSALMWNGIPVVKSTAWEAFYNTVGVTEHRAVLTATGNFGVAHRAEEIIGEQDGGISMMIEQSKRLQDRGKIYMSTNFRLGSSILDPDFVTMAKLTLAA